MSENLSRNGIEIAIKACDNTDTGRYGATTNKLELTNLGISGQTQHGTFIPELRHDPITSVQPNDSLTSYGNEKIVFDLRADTNYVYEDTLEIPYCRSMTFNGAIDDNYQTQISGDISTTPNSSLVTLTNGDTCLTFNNIIFVGKNPVDSQGAIIDCGGNNNTEVIFNNCKFTVTPYILKDFSSGKVVFKNCIFTANYVIQFGYAGTGNKAEIFVDSCVFTGSPNGIKLVANSAGCTFIVTNNKVDAITTNPISAFPSTVYEWNNGTSGGGGGSGSSGYSETILWTNPTSGYPSPQGSVEITDNVTNYDAIYVVGGIMANNVFQAAPTGVIPVSEFVNGEEFLWEYDNLYYGTNYVDDTHIHIGGVATGGRTLAYKKIIGLKYGTSGGKSSAYTEDILWENTTSVSQSTFTLTKRADSYNTITLCLAFTGSAAGTYKFITMPNGMIGAGISENYGTDHWFGLSFNDPPISGDFTCVGQWILSKIIGIKYGGGSGTTGLGVPDYDNRIQFTQADLPYTVPCDGYLYIGGWQSRVSLKFKDANNEYIHIAFASTSGAISEYGMYPVTKGMILEYNEIAGNEAKMYIVPMKYKQINK